MTPEALAALHARCFNPAEAWSAASFAGLLGSPGVFLEQAPAGIALGRVTLDEAELLTLAVEPAQRRQGAGARLLAAFEAAAIRRGAARAFLEVAADNIAAIALYRRAGYAISGRRRGYYRTQDGQRVDALLMDRPLLPPPV